MALQPVKTTGRTGVPVFAKILEFFTGGFSLTVTGFNSDVNLPSGSLLKVDEEARTALPIKTAVAGTAGASGVAYVNTGHHFQVGDVIGVNVGGTAAIITAVADGTSTFVGWSKISASGIPAAASGDILFEATGASGTAAIKTIANSLLIYDTLIETGATVTALRRGTAYKKRLQSHQTGHLADLPATIQLSTSY
jgi:hypothetical protein